MAAPLPPHAAPGTVVAEKYLLEAVIGRGGMGVVLAARHLALGKRVAVKLLLAEADANARARFQLEAQAAAQLTSPHVAQVIDFGFTADGLPYLVMEFLEGQDLATLRRERGGRVPIELAVDLVIEAALGLAQAHAAGLVHRDVKPANLFASVASGRRTVKILDFGLIKVMDDAAALTGTTETFGTPKYMAPEQLRSARGVDARADQHALGAVLFELIAGRAPFVGSSIPEIILAIGTEPAPTLRSIGVEAPPELEAALQRSLAKRPEDRFPSLAELAEAIAPFGSASASRIAVEVRAGLFMAGGPRVNAEELRRVQERSRPSSPSSPSGSTRDPSSGSPSGAATPSLGPTWTPPPEALRISPPTAVLDDPTRRFPPSARQEPSLSVGSFATVQSAPGSAVSSTARKALIAAAAVTGLGIAATVGYLAARPSEPRRAAATTTEASIAPSSTSNITAPSTPSVMANAASSTSGAASAVAPPPAPSSTTQPSAVGTGAPAPPAPSFVDFRPTAPPTHSVAPAPKCTGGLSCY